MTRINSNIPPKELKRAHLIAELREITMVPAALRRSLRTKTESSILGSIPGKFTLNSGHVKFFYDKQKFLITRFNALCDEMERRGYKPDRTRVVSFNGLPSTFYSDWQSSEDDDNLVRQRIALRISQKPHLYED